MWSQIWGDIILLIVKLAKSIFSIFLSKNVYV